MPRKETWLSDLSRLTDELKRPGPFFLESHGKPSIDDPRVLSGIAFGNPNDLHWRDRPINHGPAKTL